MGGRGTDGWPARVPLDKSEGPVKKKQKCEFHTRVVTGLFDLMPAIRQGNSRELGIINHAAGCCESAPRSGRENNRIPWLNQETLRLKLVQHLRQRQSLGGRRLTPG